MEMEGQVGKQVVAGRRADYGIQKTLTDLARFLPDTTRYFLGS